MEQFQKVDKVALEESPASQVLELAAREAQPAQTADLAFDLGDVRRQVDPRRAAFEAVLHLRCREMVQHHLHHRELVQVGVEQ